METILLNETVTTSLLIHLFFCASLWILVICAIGLDLWDGIRTAKILKQRIHSHKTRVTIEKMSEYWRFMLIAFIVDAIIFLAFLIYSPRPTPVLSFIFCLGLVGIEVKSMVEHAQRRKSKALEMHHVIKLIIDASTDRDAKKTLQDIREYFELDQQKQTATNK